jgi:transposase InsO family protein
MRFLTHLIRHYRTLGIKIAGVFTHNGAAYRSKGFRRACDRMGLRSYQNDRERAKALPAWLHRYNWHRPHASLDYQPPIRRLGLSLNNLSALHI